jgi:alpha-amylase/alpha-mannosidase (GH57 family)
MAADLAIALYWHQHQPYYPDDLGGTNPMPWVRLHGVKDYYGMALHLLEVPEMRCTINLVPSLLVQIQAYADGTATDRPLDATLLPAAHLSETDAEYILDNFFMANPDHVIRPWPRYYELLLRRGLGRTTAAQSLKRFGERDLLDLQVLFNLAWIHPLAFDRDADLRALRDKGRLYSEDDKQVVVRKHREILRQIIPLHRRLQDHGQVELTTTPFYHPILPLLFDKRLARQAMPDVKLPRYVGGYPEDAAVHVGRALEQHQKLFGMKPRGMWPAEGSVCQEMIPLLAEHGIEWIATDEEILSQSTQGFVCRDAVGHVVNAPFLYRPYRVQQGDSSLGIVFRDHALSDMIGFHYQRSPGGEAADDFLRHLHNLRQALDPSQPALVSVILDGENCWEHYPEGGVPFLRALYDRCTKTPQLRPVKIGDYLREHPPRDHLPNLFAGSWIHHNFAIWIGHDEDNTAWDLLHQTREHLVSRIEEGTVPPEQALRAWEEIFIAEGSDWFWWFGDDHSSAQDALFDSLFRRHLQNVHLLLGESPPPELSRPISRSGAKSPYTEPSRFLNVKIDGRANFVEWFCAGHYRCQNERGTMAMVTTGPIRDLYYGFSLTDLIFRVDFDRPAREALVDYDEVRIGFNLPSGIELCIRHAGRPKQSWDLLHEGVLQSVGDEKVQIGVDRILEGSIPFSLLGVDVGEPVRFYVELRESRQSRDRAPRDGEIQFQRPSRAFEAKMWNA